MGACELSALFSEAKARVLQLLVLHPESSYYQREIAERTGLRLRAVQQAVRPMVEAGIVRRDKRGNQVFYCADPNCPILPELTGLITKTIGIAEPLRRALEPLRDGIAAALVFGSFASARFRPGSDVDVLVVGEVSPRRVVGAMGHASEEIGREVNAVVMTEAELRARAERDDHFIRSVLAGPTIFVIGDSDELGAIAEREPDRTSGDDG